MEKAAWAEEPGRLTFDGIGLEEVMWNLCDFFETRLVDLVNFIDNYLTVLQH